MDSKLILWPVLAHVLLVCVLYLRLKSVKSAAVRAGTVDLKRRALDSDAWPDEVRQVSNNIRNQFEAPTMFYV